MLLIGEIRLAETGDLIRIVEEELAVESVRKVIRAGSDGLERLSKCSDI